MTTSRALLIVAATITVFAVSPADAKHRARHHAPQMSTTTWATGKTAEPDDRYVNNYEQATTKPVRVRKINKIKETGVIDVKTASDGSLEMSAKKRVRHVRRGGKCDGFNACRCGVTAARRHGLALDHNGWNLKMAREYKRFPHVGFQVGAIGIRPDGHHALTIEGGSDCRMASVSDENGTYQRNVCGFTFVSPSGGGFATYVSTSTLAASVRTETAASANFYDRAAIN